MTPNRTAWVLIVLAAALLTTLTGCRADAAARRQARPAQPAAPAAINHLVFFKLHDPADADALVAESRDTLSRIPGVLSLFAGTRLDTGRPIAQTDYDACVYAGFATPDDYAAYLADPRHTALVARWKDRFEWYKVYDIADKTYDPALAGCAPRKH